MKIPAGMTEQQLVDELYAAANCFKNFKFGYFDEQDIVQFCIVEAIKVLDKYDPARNIGPFLKSHMYKRLVNLKRDKFKRKEPCYQCPLKAFMPPNKCSAFDNRLDCGIYDNWHKINSAKQNIVNPINIDNVDDENENNMKYTNDFGANIDSQVLYQQIDINIPLEVRKDYLRFLAGIRLLGNRKQILLRHINQIVESKNLI